MAPTQKRSFKLKIPFIRRRHTRSYGEMDFLPQLPEEVLLMILKYVSVKDLGRCLSVSKTWYNMINVDSVWKRRCLAYGVSPIEEKNFVRDGKSSLCKWAQIWRGFRKSPSYGWRTRCWKTMELDRGGIYMKNASDGNSIVFCTESHLTLRRAAQLGKTKYNIKLPFPSDALSNLAVDNEYIAVSKGNMLVIYKLGKSRFRCIFALSLDDDVITKANSSISTFVKSRFREVSQSICILAFSKGCVWMREQGGYKTYVLNLTNKRISEVEPHFYRYITQSYIVSWSRKKLRVDNFMGRNVLKLCRDINKARANNKVLVTFGYKTDGEGSQQIMETWDLVTGHRLLCLPRPKNSFFEIHPTLNILYQIEAGRGCVTSFCAITGKEYWSSKVPTVIDMMDWCVRVVCQRYLVIFQFKSCCVNQHNELFVFDVNDGRFLYKTDRPPGHLDHISDNLLISKTPCKIYVRTYLTSRSSKDS